MIKPGSPIAALMGRWGAATVLVVGAVLIGRIIRDVPYLLPNWLPGLVLYELGPGMALTFAVGLAVRMTRGLPSAALRFGLFLLLAIVTGTILLWVTFAASLGAR